MTSSEFISQLPYYLLIYVGCSFVGVGIYGLIRMCWDAFTAPGIKLQMDAQHFIEDWRKANAFREDK